MKAMIFAAGLGTRLRPLTDHTPKALVSVAGKPMLERVILRLNEAGFNDITVNIHHFGEQIIEFLRANNDFGITIHLSDERDMLLDTGGGIKKARPFLDGNEPFLVHNADILSDINLAELYRHHRESNAEATPSPKDSLSKKGNTRKWLSVAFTSYPLPFSAIWKADNGKGSSPLFLFIYPCAKQLAYRVIRFRTAVGSTSASRKHLQKQRNTTDRKTK